MDAKERPPMQKWALQLLLLGTLGGVLFPAVGGAAEYDARLAWSQRVALGTTVSGVVHRLDAIPGHRVARGTLLLELDGRQLRADLKQAEAMVKRLNVARDEAQKEQERTEELYDRTLLSERDLQSSWVTYLEAEATYQQSLARQTEAQMALEYSRIVAPFDALVLAVHVAVGEPVISALQARPLIELAHVGQMVARAQIGATEAAGLKPGDRAEVTVAGERYSGTIHALGYEPITEGGEELYSVDVLFKPAALLRAGQRARVNLP